MLKLIQRVLALSGDLKPRILWGFAFGFIEGIFQVFPLLALFYALGSYLGGGVSPRTVAITAALLLAGMSGRIVFRYLLSRFQSSAGFEMIAAKRLQFGELLRRAPMAFFDAHKQGELTACLTTDLSFIEMYVMFILDKVVNGFLMTVISGAFLLIFNLKIGAAALLSLLPSLLVFALLQKSGKKLGPLRQNAQAELGAAVIEYAQGIMTAKAYGMKGRQAKRLSDAFHRSNLRSYQVERGFVRWVSLFQLIVKLSGCVVALAAALAALAGAVTPPVFLMLLVASFTMFAGLDQCVSQTPMLRIMEASLDRVEAITGDERGQTADPPPCPAPAGFDLTFDHVSFDYGGGPVLRDVSFHVGAHTSTALVGPSGSGKSTVTKLIPGFYPVTQGAIRIGGVDIRAMPQAQLLSCVSMVFQEVYLFQDTVAANIRFGKKDATLEEVADAAKKACCYDFIMELPQGFDTVLGEGGNTLSGGQRQRISIARAILKDAPIILLDEATSGVDPQNEALIQQAIDQLVKDKTVIIIAHNLSAVRTADQILVLDHGKITQSGTHDALRQTDGLYKELWTLSRQVDTWAAAPVPPQPRV